MVKQVGHWVLRSVLGQGSFGEVYLGTHADSGKKVAIKVCTKQMLAKGQGRALLQREIATMKALDHKHVLRLYEVLETTKRFYLVIELATSGDLLALIKSSKGFDDTTARSYFRQLLEGVHYCHEQGVVHRDLKPQNLLLTAEKTLKIADFGFSRFQDLDENGEVSQSVRLQTQCGTPNYAAPEIFIGQGYDGFKTDIWACGVILYVMISGGVVPFKPQGGQTGLNGVIMSIVKGLYSIPSYFPEDATNIIKRILVTDPKDRAAMKDLFRHPYVQRPEEFEIKIPKIVVSDDQVRNSIVCTKDDDDDEPTTRPIKGTGSPHSPASPTSPSQLLAGNGHRARGATFSTQTASTSPSNLNGTDKKVKHQDPSAARPLSPVSASLLGSPADAQARAKQASFNTLGKSPVLDLELMGSETTKTPTTPTTPGVVSQTSGGSGFSTPSTTQPVINKSRSRTVVVENSQEDLVRNAQATGNDAPSPETRTAHVFKRKHWNILRSCFYCGKCIYGVGKQGFSCILCECPVHIKCVDAASQNSCCEQYKARVTK